MLCKCNKWKSEISISVASNSNVYFLLYFTLNNSKQLMSELHWAYLHSPSFCCRHRIKGVQFYNRKRSHDQDVQWPRVRSQAKEDVFAGTPFCVFGPKCQCVTVQRQRPNKIFVLIWSTRRWSVNLTRPRCRWQPASGHCTSSQHGAARGASSIWGHLGNGRSSCQHCVETILEILFNCTKKKQNRDIRVPLSVWQLQRVPQKPINQITVIWLKTSESEAFCRQGVLRSEPGMWGKWWCRWIDILVLN